METKKIDREYLLTRLEDWTNRISNLFNKIEEWAKDYDSNIKIMRKPFPQTREELMAQFDIEPSYIDHLQFFHENKRISFIPMGLWVIGSNGRINITTNQNQYILVDLSEKFDESQWKIVNPAKRKDQIEFNSDILKRIIRDEKLFS